LLAEILGRVSLPAAPVLLACGGLVVLLVIVVLRYDLAVGVGLLLMAVVLVEPAPSDVVFGLVMIVGALTGRFKLAHLPRVPRWAVAAIIVLNVVSLTDVISWSAAGRFLLITVYLNLFALWLANYIDQPSRARRLVQAYLLVGVLSAVLGSLALFVHFPGHQILIGDGDRAKALFKDPNVFGPFLVPIAVILAEELLRPRLVRLRRVFRFAAFLILTLGVLFSYSRAAWLNYAVAMIVLIGLVVLRRPDRRAIALFTVIIVGSVCVAGAIVATGQLSFLRDRARTQSYDTYRFAAQAAGERAGLDHPFGVGPGQFEVISPVASHSLYVRVLAEQGVLGLAAIVLLLIATLAIAAVSVLRGRDTFGISAAALLAAWCGLIVNSFFVDTLHWRHLWLVAGLIWSSAAVRPASAPAARAGEARAAPLAAA
jgi:O-antigen ligase